MNNLTGNTSQKIEFLIKKNDRLFKELIQSWCPNHLVKDFYQDFMLILYSYPKNKMESYIKQNAFNYLAVAIIKNNLKSSTSPFYRTYINPGHYEDTMNYKINGANIIQNYEDDIEYMYIKNEELIEEENEKKDKLNQIHNILNIELAQDKKFIRDKKVFEMYYEMGTMRKVSKKTKIPVASVYRYIKNAENVVKNGIKKKQE